MIPMFMYLGVKSLSQKRVHTWQEQLYGNGQTDPTDLESYHLLQSNNDTHFEMEMAKM